MSYTNLRNDVQNNNNNVWILHAATNGYMNFYTHEFPNCPNILFDVRRRAGDSSQISLVLTNVAFRRNRENIVNLFQEHQIEICLERRYNVADGLGRIFYPDDEYFFAEEINNVEDMNRELTNFHDQFSADIFRELAQYIQ